MNKMERASNVRDVDQRGFSVNGCVRLSLHTSVYPRFTRLQEPVSTSLVRGRQRFCDSDQMVLEWIIIICPLLCWQRAACRPSITGGVLGWGGWVGVGGMEERGREIDVYAIRGACVCVCVCVCV